MALPVGSKSNKILYDVQKLGLLKTVFHCLDERFARAFTH